jgi:hypothetical protein
MIFFHKRSNKANQPISDLGVIKAEVASILVGSTKTLIQHKENHGGDSR